MSSFLDAHSHVKENFPFPSICNGTSPGDWEDLSVLKKRYPDRVFPCYGIHPWFLEGFNESWFELLKRYLASGAAGIGEIGLDRAKQKNSMELQVRVFKAQLKIAAAFQLPVSVHCVRAWGQCMEILKEVYIPSGLPFIIHSFTGSAEMMQIITKKGGYLTFGPELLKEERQKLREVFIKTPVERLLFETDSESGSKPERSLILERVYETGAELKGMDTGTLRDIVWENGKIFTDGTPARQG